MDINLLSLDDHYIAPTPRQESDFSNASCQLGFFLRMTTAESDMRTMPGAVVPKQQNLEEGGGVRRAHQ